MPLPLCGSPFSDNNGGLGGGAIAGIIIAVILLIVIGLLVAFIIYKKRKNEELPEFMQSALNAPAKLRKSTRSSAPAVEKRRSKPNELDEVGAAPARQWKIGDTCMAMFSEDKEYYRAKLEDYDPPSDHYLVFFEEYGNREWCPSKYLKKI